MTFLPAFYAILLLLLPTIKFEGIAVIIRIFITTRILTCGDTLTITILTLKFFYGRKNFLFLFDINFSRYIYFYMLNEIMFLVEFTNYEIPSYYTIYTILR